MPRTTQDLSPEKLLDDSRRISTLVKETTHIRLATSDQESGSILEHQIDATLAGDLACFFPDAQAVFAATQGMTFRRLFLEKYPPVELLRLVKDLAKMLNQHSLSAYPEDVAAVLYIASVAAAETGARTCITSQPREKVEANYRWALARTWVPEDLKELFRKALVKS